MEKYFGNIKIGATENTTGGNSSSELISSAFIHYPDCQQLIIRLPQNGWDGYGAIRLLDSDTKKILGERPLTNRLNGNTQVMGYGRDTTVSVRPTTPPLQAAICLAPITSCPKSAPRCP